MVWVAKGSVVVIGLAFVAMSASMACAQQSETISGQPQQVVPQTGETGVPPAQNQVGSPVVTSGGAPPLSTPAGGTGSAGGGSTGSGSGG
jgi:hypothetical protein